MVNANRSMVYTNIMLLGSVLMLANLLTQAAASNPCASSAALAASVETLDVQEQAIAAQLPSPSTSLQRQDLPLARPVQPWPFRNISTAIDAPYPTTDSITGVTYSRLQHAPIQNVTAGLMLWWFRQNLEKVVEYPWGGGNYSRYLIWHPRDHCHQKDFTKTNWLLQEFFLASKYFTRRAYKGFNDTTEAQINLNMTVESLNSTGLTLSYVILGVEVTKLQHTWHNTPKGLSVLSQVWIGNPVLAAPLNQQVNCAFSRGDDPLTVARKLQVHTVEEFGNLEKVLPYIYSVRHAPSG